MRLMQIRDVLVTVIVFVVALAPYLPIKNSFQMSIESNNVIAIASLSDWLKNLVSGFEPMRSKSKTNRTLCA